MNILAIHILALLLTTGRFLQSYGAEINDRKRILDALLAKKGDPPKPDKANNPYLSKFLDEHSRPSVRQHKDYDHLSYRLTIDDRYQFKPGLLFAPFSSVGEPWPLPKKYNYAVGKTLLLDDSVFTIKILNKTCDILTEAIARYMKIIKNHIIEEHYDFVFNYNEKTFSDRKKMEDKRYEHIEPMPNLEIDVLEDDCGYPHIDMNESYKLVVLPSLVRLTANQVWGAIRGLETFSQLLFKKRNTDEIYAKFTEIEDEPRFPHRGILVDTSRHFIQKNVIKQVMDGMAYNKMNVLHWHIVDDNSFPYQSEVFPDLSAKGAFHPDLVYTIKDIKDLVEYARYRGIRVIPEFDTPGHTFSWLGYPEIKSTCYTNDGEVPGPIGPINPAKDETYNFMAKLFNEIFDVFKDSFVHLGGDELASKCWATNPSIIAYLQANANIPAYAAKSNAESYVNLAVGYYFKRLIKTLENTSAKKQQKKSFIMWEDVLKNTEEIPKDSILQVWMAAQAKVISLNQRGYRALYSSCWYLDNYKIGVLWTKLYQCDPSPYMTEEEEKGNLMGGEACLWAEYITSDTLMSFMWPRACAPAERLWSPKAATDIISAQRRIQEQRCRMIYRGLPTGHISGPDYCLHPKDGKMEGIVEDNESDELNVGQQEADFAVRNDNNMSMLVFENYHPYIPVFNVLISLTGIYLIIFATCCWRRKGLKGLCRVV